MKKSTTAVAALVLVVVGVGGYLYRQQREAAPADAPARIEAPVVTEREPQAPLPEPAPHYPVAAPVADDAAGAAADPDAKLLAALRTLFGASVDTVFNTTDIVRRIVVTVDNLPREKVARRLMPVKPVPGPMVTAGSGDTLVLDTANAARYRIYMQFVDTVSTAALVDVYVRNYPAFQQHYVELGYPDGYFNNRLVAVIDHLLAAPEPAGPLRLAQPKVLYTFSDPELEKLSEGQKIMLRMGPDNAARVKAKLREIRAAVTTQAPGAK